MERILIASPVKQKPAILAEFLMGLRNLSTTGLDITYLFIDDHEEVSELLLEFAREQHNCRIVRGDEQGVYLCDEEAHQWQEQIMWKVARYKDECIKVAVEQGYDYVFLVDSDLVLHPDTLIHLVRLRKDIVSEVFWTKWEPGLPALPQVWVSGQYSLHAVKRGEKSTAEEIASGQRHFLGMLRCPGTYQVGGLGACTLISRRALQAGVSFKEIVNLELVGEDRHFCIRAAALGLTLYADTHYPPYHIYRESELAGMDVYKARYNFDGQRIQPRLTIAMLVRNEADRYLRQVLTQAVSYADDIVILDDASVDDTVKVCREVAAAKLRNVVINKQSEFHNEIKLRKQLWEMAIAVGNEWIMILDADELFESSVSMTIPALLRNPDIDVYTFRLFDMWNTRQYREDGFWQAHKVHRPFLVRNRTDIAYAWLETPQHCGRFPANILQLPTALSQLRIKHLGWIRAEDKLQKFYRYRELDPAAKYGLREQYDSILDPTPVLIDWQEET